MIIFTLTKKMTFYPQFLVHLQIMKILKIKLKTITHQTYKKIFKR